MKKNLSLTFLLLTSASILPAQQARKILGQIGKGFKITPETKQTLMQEDPDKQEESWSQTFRKQLNSLSAERNLAEVPAEVLATAIKNTVTERMPTARFVAGVLTDEIPSKSPYKEITRKQPATSPQPEGVQRFLIGSFCSLTNSSLRFTPIRQESPKVDLSLNPVPHPNDLEFVRRLLPPDKQ